MATKKFPSELALRGTVLVTDKLLIHNITTGATSYCTVANLFASPAFTGTLQVGTTNNRGVRIYGSASPYGALMMGAAGGYGQGYYFSGSAGTILGGFGVYGTDDALNQFFIGTYADQKVKFLANGNVVIGDGAASGNILIGGNCSALSFTDRTPHYAGDAVSEIKKITGKNGLIDHKSLPAIVQVKRVQDIFEDKAKTVKGKKVIERIKVGEEIIAERDLGAMISVLTVAVQQLTARIEKLETK